MPGLAPAGRWYSGKMTWALPERNAWSVFLDLPLPGPVSLLHTLVIAWATALAAVNPGAHFLPS